MINECEKCGAPLIIALIKNEEVVFLDKESDMSIYYNGEQVLGLIEHIVICKGDKNGPKDDRIRNDH